MARGGHARSGPQPTEGSRNSDRKGFSLSALPPEGYAGDVPDLLTFLPDATQRHLDIWAQLWTTPQACAWSEQPYRWPVVADLVMWMVRAQAEDASAAMGTVVRQLRDDCGLSLDGKTQGWKIGDVAPTVEPLTTSASANVTSIKTRLPSGGA